MRNSAEKVFAHDSELGRSLKQWLETKQPITLEELLVTLVENSLIEESLGESSVVKQGVSNLKAANKRDGKQSVANPAIQQPLCKLCDTVHYLSQCPRVKPVKAQLKKEAKELCKKLPGCTGAQPSSKQSHISGTGCALALYNGWTKISGTNNIYNTALTSGNVGIGINNSLGTLEIGGYNSGVNKLKFGHINRWSTNQLFCTTYFRFLSTADSIASALASPSGNSAISRRRSFQKLI